MSLFTATSLIFLGLVPSFSWLGVYLKKDAHPEPRYLLSQTFLLGMITAPFVIVFQLLFHYIFGDGTIVNSDSSGFLLWAAFVEEFFKFFIIWLFIIKNREFNEPVDAMIYMIVAGLGFAAIENILFLFKVAPEGLTTMFSVWGLRFIGATLLHALAAAITGYFLAMAWFFYNHAYKLIVIGLFLATLFHFTFNILILQSANNGLTITYSFILLIIMTFLVSILFRQLWIRSRERIKRIGIKNQI